jgi:hypothetical protein
MSFTLSAVTASHTVSVTFAINQYIITATAGPNGAIAPAGAATVNYGGSQSYLISPNSGYHIVDVQVDGVSKGPVTTYSFSSVTANHSVSATFAINTYPLTLSGPNGKVTENPAQSVYDSNSVVQLTAIPNLGYHFAGWTGDTSGTGGGTANPLSVTMNGPRTIVAHFAIDTFTISTSAPANAAFSPAGSVIVNYGTDRSFAVTPTPGYHVDSLFVDGVNVGPLTAYTFSNVTSAHSIAATVLINNDNVSTSADGGSGSLRDAILSANAQPGPDTIRILLAGPGVQTISPLSPLPSLHDSVVVDASAMHGLFTLNGSSAGGGTNGLTLMGNNIVVRGLSITQFSGAGIFISGNNNRIGGTAAGDPNVMTSNGVGVTA